MSSPHKFKPGATVTLMPHRHGENHRGSFEVVRLLPAEHGHNQYRIKSRVDGHERVVTEAEVS